MDFFFVCFTVSQLAPTSRVQPGQMSTRCFHSYSHCHGDLRCGNRPVFPVRQWPGRSDQVAPEHRGSDHLDLRRAVLCLLLPGHDCRD